MKNLRGGTYERQARDAFFLLLAYGESRKFSKKKGQTHSLGTAKKRKTELNQFRRFIEEEGFTCKMNRLMEPRVLDKFFTARLKKLVPSSKETTLRLWSAMTQGLQEKFIDVPVSKSYFNRKVEELRQQGSIRIAKKNQSIKGPESIIVMLYAHRYEVGVYAEVLMELGIRASEAIELIRNHHRYVTVHREKYEISHLVGKGNHEYGFKEISPKLVQKIERVRYMPSYSTLYRDLRSIGITAHRFRYTYAKEQIHDLFTSGLHLKDAYSKISKELNHKRAEMTKYYLIRA